MKDEKKKRQTQSKIIPFDIDKTPTDDEIDHILSDSMNEGADQYEEEMLRRNPKLKDVHAPDDLYASIVQKLKEQGAWEEDESAETRKADIGNVEDVNADAAEAEAVRGLGEIRAEATLAEEAHAEKAEDFCEVKEHREEEEKYTEEYMHGHTEEETYTEKTMRGQAEKGEAYTEEIMRGYTEKGEEQALDALYAMLPEEDRHALEIGRQVRRENAVRETKRKRRSKVFKYGGLVAAMFVVVFSVSMTSEANRRLVLQAWDGLMYNMGFRVTTNYMDDESGVRSTSKEELEAMETIRETLDIPVINFDYLPEGMEYQDYEIMEDAFEAILFYTYQGKTFHVTMININDEATTYYAIDNEAERKRKVETLQEMEASIWEINRDQDGETYMAEIDYNNCRYILNGMISLEEMEEILKYAVIL
jgi:hypothetical protein